MDSSSLLNQLKQAYKVSDKDCARLIQLFEPLEVKKNEHLFRSGEIARHVYFIDKGSSDNTILIIMVRSVPYILKWKTGGAVNW